MDAVSTLNVTIQLKEFAIPPVRDAVVLGKRAPIGATAMKKALALLQTFPFDHIKMRDDAVVGDILVRSSLMQRLTRDHLVSLVTRRVKPLMSDTEIMNLAIDVDLMLEEQM